MTTPRKLRWKARLATVPGGTALVQLQWNLRKAVRQPGWAYRTTRARVNRSRRALRRHVRTTRREARRVLRRHVRTTRRDARRATRGARGRVRALRLILRSNPGPTSVGDPFRRGTDFSSQAFREQHIGLPANEPLWNGHLTVGHALSHPRATPRWLPLHRRSEVPDGIAIAVVCTDKFAIGLEALVLSLQRHHPGLTADFHVFHDGGLSEFNQQRLLRAYPHFVFAERDVTRYDVASAGEAPNHRRIGSIGYLNLETLTLRGYRRVVLLDADLLVTAPIGELWDDPDADDVRVVADAGNLPLTTVSNSTGQTIFNSGVISFPVSMLDDDIYRHALDFLPEIADDPCPLLGRFADQRFWNLFMSRLGHELTYLPAGLNANKKLIEQHYPSQLGNTAIVHYTSSKPWFEFADQALVSIDERRGAQRLQREFPITFSLWRQTYQNDLATLRVRSFERDMGDRLGSLRQRHDGDDIVLIGNGPSLARTDLTLLRDRPRFTFNWFVNHPDFDEIRPDHLVLMSHMFFGGWFTSKPTLPDGFVDKLRRHSWKPELWVPHYFKDFIDTTVLAEEYSVNYLLFEKPFKRFADDIDVMNLDPRTFLTDCRTGVLTAGCPLAAWMGARRIVLVGCDSSYGQPAAGGGGGTSEYFYDASEHTSASTRRDSLDTTWVPEGPGQRNYAIAHRTLAEQGVELVDATVGGFLRTVPKLSLSDLSSRSRP